MTGSSTVMHHPIRKWPLGLSLLLLPLMADASDSATKTENPAKEALLQFHTTLKMEAWSLRNKSLRKGEKRENELELEPLARFRVDIAKDRPVYGAVELELTDKTTRKSGEPSENKTKLDLTQAYVGIDSDTLNTDFRMGRWLYRDMREWLFDENMDGMLARWKKGDWQADVLGARVNYMQKDLLDRGSRNNSKKSTLAMLLRFKMDKNWQIGGYMASSKNTRDEGYKQIHYGLRSHNNPKKGLRHWAELGMMSGDSTGTRHQGYVVDVGATWIFDSPLRPRVTLGYALASKHYRQTGLQSNEASFAGGTKFNIYGNTLAPELANLQVFTAGIGIDITPDSDLELVYHHYRQTQMADLKAHDPELKSRYDRRTTHRLGDGVDLIWGVDVTKNLRTELLAGAFMPARRFRSSSSDSAPRSSPAYSVGFEAELKF